MRHCAATGLAAVLFATLAWGLEPANVQFLEPGEAMDSIVAKAAHVVPAARQIAYQRREFSGFIHFGPNTFTGREWGTGKEDPVVFNPTDLDADQWCEAMQEAEMQTVVITAKHHDGFVLWPSRYTRHGVMSSPWRAGAGDVVREFVDACRARGLKIGFYLSPADLYQMASADGLYGNRSDYRERSIPREVAGRPFADRRRFTVSADDYNEYFMNQLFELLTEYGPVHEVWFDGAHPRRKGGQTYIRQDWYRMIRELAPEAVIFGGPDARWVGNEAGDTRATEWSVIPVEGGTENLDRTDKDLGSRKRLANPVYDVYGRELVADRLHWQIAEVDTSVRHGWFYRDERQGVRSADDVFDIYERSVGGNSVFLLNVPPDTRGRLPQRDVAVLREVGKRIRHTYDTDLLTDGAGPRAVLDGDAASYWQPEEPAGQFELHLPLPVLLNRFLLQEAIGTHGQRIEQHALDVWLEGKWREVARGTTVGYKRILRFEPVHTDRLRVRIISSRLQPTVSAVSAHYYPPQPALVEIARDARNRVTLTLPAHRFRWNPGRLAFDAKAKRANTVIRYTTDGTEPMLDSALYRSPFRFSQGGTIRARAFLGDTAGPESARSLSISQRRWQVMGVSSEKRGPWYKPGSRHTGSKAIDGNPATAWIVDAESGEHHIAVDFGKVLTLSGMTYLPAQTTEPGRGAIAEASLQWSNDGTTWQHIQALSFGNIVNDPTQRTVYFGEPVQTRYLRLLVTAGAVPGAPPGIAELGFLP